MNKESIMPSYVFQHLAEYKNVLIGRRYLIQYGPERIIAACQAEGYRVRLIALSHGDFSVARRRRKAKAVQYPKDTSYILEVI